MAKSLFYKPLAILIIEESYLQRFFHTLEKDELIEFLYNERKVIKVTAKVSIQVNEIPVGTVFTGRSVHE